MSVDYGIQPKPITTPANVALTAVVVCALTMLACVGGSWAGALHVLLTDGLITLAWLGAATGAGLALLRAANVRFATSSLHLACAAALGLGVESLLILGLGWIGAMNRVSAVALVALGLLLLAWCIPPLVARRRPMDPSAWAWLWLLAMPGLGIALACATLPPGILWQAVDIGDPHGYDVVEYHLQVPREWYERGRIVPLEHNVFSYFPLGVETHYLLAMHLRGGPWAGMYLAQLMNVGFVALSVLAAYGLLVESGAPHPTLGAVAAGTTPWMVLLAPVAYNEGGLVMYGTLAIGLMLIAVRSSAPVRTAALAGAMAGFACGTKLTAVPFVLLAAPAAALASIALRKEKDTSSSSRKTYLHPFIYLVVGAAVFSPWLIRNVAWTSNPFYPEAARVFGRAHFSERQVERWARAYEPRGDQRRIAARFGAFAHQVLLDWRFGFALLPLAVAAAVLERRRRETIYLLLILLMLTALWLFLTHLQSRFFVLAIPVAAMLIGLLRDTRAAIVAAMILALAAVAGAGIVYAKLRANLQIFQAVGIERLTVFTPLADVTLRPDEQLILLGDARAFLYDMPMTRLQYRTVFDVPPDDWMSGMRVEPGKTLVLVDPGELARFASTYRDLPPLPHTAVDRTAPYFERP